MGFIMKIKLNTIIDFIAESINCNRRFKYLGQFIGEVLHG